MAAEWGQPVVYRSNVTVAVDVHDPKKTKSGRTATARNKIRSCLNNFAAPGSQMKSIRMDDEEDDDGDVKMTGKKWKLWSLMHLYLANLKAS